ncbi:alpha/beta hydrolase [Paenibacillus campi]|uniref:alpha/beta fold hydrolase n=1 Tax=Paenibacillus campi TaxID=3106031 RepID=UPI002AFE06BB|nr:alpha/beta hydrolase [Paenibacillus sp. SGZ-1009]
MINVHRHTIQLQAVRLFYLDTHTEGPVIVCLHGRYGRAETWYDFMQQYGHRYRIIAPEQRGHGLSDQPLGRYTAEELAEDAHQFMDALGIASAIVIGHSLGGQVAAYWAATYPQQVRALAILDKAAFGPKERVSIPLEQLPVADSVTADWPLPFASRTAAEHYLRKTQDTEISCQYFMNSLVETEQGATFLFSRQAMAANILHNVSWYHMLEQIHCPALLIRAHNSESLPDEEWEKMKRLVPHGIAYEMTSEDHNVHLSEPERFYRYVDTFLQSFNA